MEEAAAGAVAAVVGWTGVRYACVGAGRWLLCRDVCHGVVVAVSGCFGGDSNCTFKSILRSIYFRVCYSIRVDVGV